jgi:hypothetical protein
LTTPIDITIADLFEAALDALEAAQEEVLTNRRTATILAALLAAVEAVVVAGRALLRAVRGAPTAG